MFNNVGIVGVGLIGASIALEIKRNNLAQMVFGFDENQKSLELATKNGTIDGYSSIKDIGVCDFVVVATPVGSIVDVLKDVIPKLKDGAIVIDVGSVKGAVVDKIKPFLNDRVHFVPIHPIAGIEKFGVLSAKEGLFEGAYCIVTPYDGINKFTVSKIENFIKALGMRIEFMDAKEHDKVFAYISHLPHLIAYALVALIEEKDDEKFKFIGGGFRDFTRIAASSEKMWSDIFLLNKDKLLESIKEFEGSVEKIKLLIENNNTEELIKYLKQARIYKESLDER